MGPGGGRYYIEGTSVSAAFGRGWFAYDLKVPSGGSLVRVNFVDANDVEPRASVPMGHESNFLLGNDPSRWVAGAGSFEQVLYDDLWDGVDLTFGIEGSELKYTLDGSPWADLDNARFGYEGARSLTIEDGSGDLLIGTDSGLIRDHAPKATQLVEGGCVDLPARFTIEGGRSVGFLVDGYDPSKPIVIDPGVKLSTMVGGNGYDSANDMCTDASGNLVLTGTATVGTFPTTPGAYDTGQNGSAKSMCAVILRLSANLSLLTKSTFLGGSSSDEGKDLTVMDDGSLWVFGVTQSDDFPTTSGAYDRSRTGSIDIFIARLSADGSSLIYSTFFGGSSVEQFGDSYVDGEGSIYLTGATLSSDLPTTSGVYDSYSGRNYNKEAFVAKLSSDVSSLLYCTYIGEEGSEEGSGIHVDTQGNAIIAGTTSDRAFPVTPGAYNGSRRGGHDVFVLSLDANASRLVFSAVFGSWEDEDLNAMSIDAEGRILLAGPTGDGEHFPRVTGSYIHHSKGSDAYVVRMTANASDLEYACVIGGRSADTATALGVLEDGRVAVTGYTQSTDFPTSEDACSRTLKGNRDVFVCELHPEGMTLVHSTLIGGTDYDVSNELLAFERGAVVCGSTGSSGFPTTAGAYSTTFAGGRDIFVLRYEFPEPDTTPPSIIKVEGPEVAKTRHGFKVYATVADDRGVHNATVRTWCDNNATSRTRHMSYVEGDRTGSKFWAWVSTHSDWPGTLYVTVRAMDTSGNINVSDPMAITMTDGLPPRIRVTWPLPNATTDDPYDVTVNVTDNFGVAEVYCLYNDYYSYLDYDQWVNGTMVAVDVTSKGNGTYGLQVPGDYFEETGYVYFHFIAVDIDNNVGQYGWIEVRVWDNDPPEIHDLSPPEATTGDAFIFTARITENIVLWNAGVSFAYGDAAPEPNWLDLRRVSGDGVFASRPIFMPDGFLGWINYTIVAIDGVGNTAGTVERWVQVVDNDPPEILGVVADDRGETGAQYGVQVSVDDNIGVERVSLLYSFGSADGGIEVIELDAVDVSDLGNGTYTGTFEVPWNESGRLSYACEAQDPSGNTARSPWVRVAIADTIPPEIVSDSSGEIALKGAAYQFRAAVIDNVGLNGVRVSYWFEDGIRIIESMHGNGTDFSRTIMVPKEISGPMGYEMTAVDVSGLVTVSEVHRVAVANSPPWLVQPVEWTVWEDGPSELDLGPYLRDSNDPVSTLSLVCHHANVTASDHVLVALYPRWVPDHDVEVLVSDGELTTSASVQVHVIPVNHPPEVRIVSPVEGAMYRLGEPIRLTATIQDLDIDEGQVLEVVWSSDQAGELTRVRHSAPGETSSDIITLPVGIHHIRVSVRDGELDAADQVVIYVNLPAPPSGPDDGGNSENLGGRSGLLGLVMLIVLVLVIALLLVLTRRYWHHGDGR